MRTKLDTLTREVFDLQETINWKDKKIGVGGPTWLLGQTLRGNRLVFIRKLFVKTDEDCFHEGLLPLKLPLHDGDRKL